MEVVLGAENLDIDPECPTCAPQQKFKITYFDVTIHENYDRKNALKIRKKTLEIVSERTYLETLLFKSLKSTFFKKIIQTHLILQ